MHEDQKIQLDVDKSHLTSSLWLSEYHLPIFLRPLEIGSPKATSAEIVFLLEAKKSVMMILLCCGRSQDRAHTHSITCASKESHYRRLVSSMIDIYRTTHSTFHSIHPQKMRQRKKEWMNKTENAVHGCSVAALGDTATVTGELQFNGFIILFVFTDH